MSIYQVGDRVFFIQKGWGDIIEIKHQMDEVYPIVVKFKSSFVCFTLEGRYIDDDTYLSLSFTEYNYITGGFSRVRPRPDLKSGDLIWVKDHGTEWLLKRFYAWTAKGVFVKLQAPSDFESAMVMEFPIYSLECPVKS